MNKLGKVALSAGLITAGLIGLAAPANAATPAQDDITIAAQGDRVEGPLVFRSATTADYFYSVKSGTPIKSGSGYRTAAEAGANSVRGTFPAPGTYGPIEIDGKCVSVGAEYRDSAGDFRGYETILATCNPNDGKQKWRMPAGEGPIQSLHFSGNRSLSLYGSRVHVATPTESAGQDNAVTSLLKPVVAAVKPVDITGPTAGANLENPRPVFSGTGEPGATVVVTSAAGVVLGTTTVGADGKWSVTPSQDLDLGEETVTATQTDKNGGKTTDRVSINIVAAALKPVDITGPEQDATVETTRPVFTGTGEPGSTVEIISGAGVVMGSTTVGADGTWTVTPEKDFDLGEETVTASQTDKNGKVTTDKVDIVIVDKDVESPIVAPGIAAIAAIGALGALGGATLRRRKDS
ncbi:Ig-like domain-containing protein [Microbacterium hydrocarbonoxydans]|uniref:Ig-like domain-containing protein n=1 Tax=Microbacterium hydrocarbonoxydans TaxID=273678 RepID=UPI00203AC61B|nr:Ig-like domain-containing protein [Microbacterium hydrocarbonoxydans]MCM3781275.1 Ig-like domain-containing protein [Microbacterium hydrocarbonoxydans]